MPFDFLFLKSKNLNQIWFLRYHVREHKIKENANCFHIENLLAKLCNIFDKFVNEVKLCFI